MAPLIDILERPPDVIRLTETSSCCCLPSSRVMYDSTMPVTTMSCEVYGLTRAWIVEIEIQKCPRCNCRFIGPDCREIGMFNWNNRLLFMHDLLDDYTCTYSTSETPFVAWVSVVSRRYESHQSPRSFISDKRFRSVWFSYARLLDLQNDLKCPICGPTPSATIWDGVTLSFSRKNLLPLMRPPTTIHSNSPIRSEIRYPFRPQCIEDRALR